jgi:hypothetical protein
LRVTAFAKRQIFVIYGTRKPVGYQTTAQPSSFVLSRFIASAENGSTGLQTSGRLIAQTFEEFQPFGRFGGLCDTITDKIITLSTPSMTTSQPKFGETSTNNTEITYVTDNARDAEVLQHQTEKPVHIQPPPIETIVCGFTEIRIRKQLNIRDARNASDV